MNKIALIRTHKRSNKKHIQNSKETKDHIRTSQSERRINKSTDPIEKIKSLSDTESMPKDLINWWFKWLEEEKGEI